MVKVALVNPGGIKGGTPQFNLGYLASYLEKYSEECEVIIVDELVQNARNELLNFEPDIVGITATTPIFPEAIKIANFLKQKLNTLLVMGGVHASVMPEEALKHVDIVVVGEGELALLEIVEKTSDNEKIREKIMTRPYIKNLDEIPPPAYHLMRMESYITSKDNPAKTFPYASPETRACSIITSRGCPYRCIFCHNSWRQTPTRYHSARRVIEEIEHLVKVYDVNSIFFVDDSFLINKPRLKEICKFMKDRGLDKRIVWGCQVRSDSVDLETLNMIKRVGCSLISIGFESGSQRILDVLKNRTVTVKQNTKAIKLAKEAGLKVGGSFMFGTPTETAEEMMSTLRFIEENDLDFCGLVVTTPYPGTALWKWCLGRNLISKNINYTILNPSAKVTDAYIICDTMPKEDFIRLFNRIQRRVAEIGYRRIYKRGYSFSELIHQYLRNPIYMSFLALKYPKESVNLLRKTMVKR